MPSSTFTREVSDPLFFPPIRQFLNTTNVWSATLRNVIIGKNQAEGVHCNGHCTLEFVWWEDVCEDALSIKNDKAGKHTWIIGGGAYHGSDKIIQHNGCGTVNIINFYVEDYGKLYRSCGNVSPLNRHSTHEVRTDSCSSAPSSASATFTLRVSLLRRVVSLLVSTQTTRTLLPSRMSAPTRRPSARCTTAARVAASPKRPVSALVKCQICSRELVGPHNLSMG